MILHRKGWRSLLFAPCLSFLLTHFIHAFENQKNCRDGECSSKEDSAESLIHRKVVVSELKKQVSEDNAKSIIYSPPTQHKEQDRKQSLIKQNHSKKTLFNYGKHGFGVGNTYGVFGRSIITPRQKIPRSPDFGMWQRLSVPVPWSIDPYVSSHYVVWCNFMCPLNSTGVEDSVQHCFQVCRQDDDEHSVWCRDKTNPHCEYPGDASYATAASVCQTNNELELPTKSEMKSRLKNNPFISQTAYCNRENPSNDPLKTDYMFYWTRDECTPTTTVIHTTTSTTTLEPGKGFETIVCKEVDETCDNDSANDLVICEIRCQIPLAYFQTVCFEQGGEPQTDYNIAFGLTAYENSALCQTNNAKVPNVTELESYLQSNEGREVLPVGNGLPIWTSTQCDLDPEECELSTSTTTTTTITTSTVSTTTTTTKATTMKATTKPTTSTSTTTTSTTSSKNTTSSTTTTSTTSTTTSTTVTTVTTTSTTTVSKNRTRFPTTAAPTTTTTTRTFTKPPATTPKSTTKSTTTTTTKAKTTKTKTTTTPEPWHPTTMKPSGDGHGHEVIYCRPSCDADPAVAEETNLTCETRCEPDHALFPVICFNFDDNNIAADCTLMTGARFHTAAAACNWRNYGYDGNQSWRIIDHGNAFAFLEAAQFTDDFFKLDTETSKISICGYEYPRDRPWANWINKTCTLPKTGYTTPPPGPTTSTTTHPSPDAILPEGTPDDSNDTDDNPTETDNDESAAALTDLDIPRNGKLSKSCYNFGCADADVPLQSEKIQLNSQVNPTHKNPPCVERCQPLDTRLNVMCCDDSNQAEILCSESVDGTCWHTAQEDCAALSKNLCTITNMNEYEVLEYNCSSPNATDLYNPFWAGGEGSDCQLRSDVPAYSHAWDTCDCPHGASQEELQARKVCSSKFQGVTECIVIGLADSCPNNASEVCEDSPKGGLLEMDMSRIPYKRLPWVHMSKWKPPADNLVLVAAKGDHKRCQPMDATFGVRCCNKISGQKKSECQFAHSGTTFAVARQVCFAKGKGWDLCSFDELKVGQSKEDGCSFESSPQWSITPCKEQTQDEIEEAQRVETVLLRTQNMMSKHFKKRSLRIAEAKARAANATELLKTGQESGKKAK